MPSQYRPQRHKGRLVYMTPFGPMSFRPAHKPPVKGGRWKVRREWDGAKPWRAFTSGKAKRFNRRFATQQEAIDHATMVADALADPTPENVARLFRTIWPLWSDEAIDRNVQRWAKFPKPQGESYAKKESPQRGPEYLRHRVRADRSEMHEEARALQQDPIASQ